MITHTNNDIKRYPPSIFSTETSLLIYTGFSVCADLESALVALFLSFACIN